MQAKHTSRVRRHLYRGHLDYDGALAELEVARQTLPNDARLFELKGYIERRRPGGNQEEALRNLERAIDLDPRNVFLLQQTAFSYGDLRRYADEEAAWTARWRSNRTTPRRKSCARRWNSTGKPIPGPCIN